MDSIVEIKLFGIIHQFKADNTVSNPQEIVDFLTKEVDKVSQKLPNKNGVSQFTQLLLTSMNISKEYLSLKKDYDALIENMSKRFNTLDQKLDQNLNKSENSLDENQPIETNNNIENKNTEKSESQNSVPEKKNPDTPDTLKITDQKNINNNDLSPLSELPEPENLTSESSHSNDQDNSINLIEEDIEKTNKPELNENENENELAVLKIKPQDSFQLPPIDILNNPENESLSFDHETLTLKSELLENKLKDFGVEGNVVGISPGPVITTFEYKPAPGIKISKIVNLTDDLALALSAISIRIVAPIPGRDVIGIEIPNDHRSIVHLKEIVASSSFRNVLSKLTICLGKDIVGRPVTTKLDNMPHLLIAGATGTGKSVGLNAMITSLLYKATPDEIKFLMIDPKRIELSFYNGIPHLICPAVTDMKKATNALFWAVREMENRYDLLAKNKVRNISQYNRKIKKLDTNLYETLPYIVIIIDEFADLMMVASRDVEVALARLAQMARAAGIHLVLATQRPSVNVLTGIIKANFPTRISFQVSSKVDSRTILDTNGAENLLGNGDMLFMPPGTAKLQRIHGAYISEDELIKVTDFLKSQRAPEYIIEVTDGINGDKGLINKEDYDELYDDAVAIVSKTRQASISSVQRQLRIGYNRAARIIEIMEKEGIVGPADGSKPREVLVQSFD